MGLYGLFFGFCRDYGGCFRISRRLWGLFFEIFFGACGAKAPKAPEGAPQALPRLAEGERRRKAAPEGPPLGEKFFGSKKFYKGKIFLGHICNSAFFPIFILKMSIFELTLNIFQLFADFWFEQSRNLVPVNRHLKIFSL